MSALLAGCFDGLRGLELRMTREQAAQCSHQGECYADCKHVAALPEIAAQLTKIGNVAIRQALKETGAWDFEELEDDTENHIRAVWLAAGDIIESNL